MFNKTYFTQIYLGAISKEGFRNETVGWYHCA